MKGLRTDLMMRLTFAAGFLAAFALCLAARGAGETAGERFTIKLNRPDRVGETYELDARGSTSGERVITIERQAPTTRPFEDSAKLEGKVKVLGVDDAGEATRLSCQIKRFVRVLKNGSVLVLPEGTTVTAESIGGKTVFARIGGTLTQDETVLLHLVLGTHIPDSPSMGDLFPVGAPVAVGTQWPANNAAMAKRIAASGSKVGPEDVSGHATLVEVNGAGPDRSMTLEFELNVTKLQLPMAEGMTEHSDKDNELKIVNVLPLDVNQPQSEMHSRNTRHVTVKLRTPDGKALGEEDTIEATRDLKRSDFGYGEN